MANVTFLREFSYDLDAATRRSFPEGWSGVVDDDVAALAAEAGAIEGVKPKGKVSAKPAADAGDTAPAS